MKFMETSSTLAFGVHVEACPSRTGGAMSMTCKATIRLICEYLEGRLAPEVASEVQRHLGSCKNCVAVFDAAALTLEIYFDRKVESPEARNTRVA
jgi:predicted anti-sigma-YlaC factor YlaD